jgi:pimeloyl-ACP methyl ester carboxylesterase
MKYLGGILGIIALLSLAAWLKLRGPDIPYPALEAKYGNGHSRYVDLPGGFHVHYQEDGNPSSRLLVLLHGFGDSYTTWEGWVAALKGQFHIISLDFPGHGLTRAPEGYQISAAGLADFVNLFAVQLSLPKFAVAGNSMGGGVAWQLALRHPSRIDALILVDAAGFPNEKPPGEVPLAFRVLQYRLGRAFLRNIDSRPLIDSGLKTDVYDKALITPALVDRWAALQRAPGHRAILMDSNFAAFGQASAVILRGVTVPTLIMHGESDVLIEPTSAGKFAAAIAGSKVITYPQVGHLPQIEIPERSAADVAVFLETIR